MSELTITLRAPEGDTAEMLRLLEDVALLLEQGETSGEVYGSDGEVAGSFMLGSAG